jgi:hypothetical protein
MKKLITIVIAYLLIGCSQENRSIEPKVKLPDINSTHIVLVDADTEKRSILTKENYIKQYNDMNDKIENIDNGDMILSLILNFARMSNDDKFGILQTDKIFSNLVELKYLELPIYTSKVNIAFLELLGKGQVPNIDIVGKDNNILVKYIKSKDNRQNENDSKDIEIPNNKEYQKRVKYCKNTKFSKLDNQINFHDVSLITALAKNDSNLTGFTKIKHKNNLKLRYVQACKDENGSYRETFDLIKKTISELIKDRVDIVTMSIGLDFDNFLNSKSSAKEDISYFNSCILNNNCPNEKFLWVVSLNNLEQDKSKNIINSIERYKRVKHTKFITTVTSISDDINKTITFEQQGQRFKHAKRDDIDYFSINLPKKTLLAYTNNELKFRRASTSYATVIFSAIVYNLYSLNPFLDERKVTDILKYTAYNKKCEENQGKDFIKYEIGKNRKEPYKIICSTHQPSRVGYIINMKKAYKEAIKDLIERHNKAFFSRGDINSSLYDINKSVVEKTKVIDENTSLVKRINIAKKNPNNMNLGEVKIIGDISIDFSKDKIVCRYKQEFYAYYNSYSDITEKEVILKYNDDGFPYIAEEKSLVTKIH